MTLTFSASNTLSNISFACARNFFLREDMCSSVSVPARALMRSSWLVKAENGKRRF